ncbi:hypothetical protein [Actinoplanes sp. NPDC049265]|uniref:hypothetical protein n=1 Tax=Actinoplanes sp. NPDC049265 TaxID=3363902 RepID=UPI00371F413F
MTDMIQYRQPQRRRDIRAGRLGPPAGKGVCRIARRAQGRCKARRHAGGMPESPVKQRCVRTLLLLLTLVPLAAGCDEGSPDTAAPASVPAPEGVDAEPPAPEGNGPEAPAPALEGLPAVPIASLPVGGVGPDEDGCTGATWLSPSLRTGVSVKITDVRIDPKDQFELSGSGCDGPICRPSFTFTVDRQSCRVAATAVGPAGAHASVILDGDARCSAERKAWCEEAKNSHGAAQLNDTRVDNGGGTPESQPEDTDPSDPTG